MKSKTVPLSEGKYEGSNLILAAAMVDVTGSKPEIDPSWFTLIFIGGKDMRALAKKLMELADHEEFMLYVRNPPMPAGSI